MTSRLHDIYLDTKDLTLEQLESFGEGFAVSQRGVNFWIGDAARAAKARLGEDNYTQIFPPWMSPGLIQRCEAVARAYPREENRNPLATWTIHASEANRPDRIQRVQAHIDAGQTSDEARKANQQERTDGKRAWLLAVDVNYYLHRFWFSGAGVEAAVGVASWIQGTVGRLKDKGLTDVACCFDSTTSHRKELTADWDDKYKDRPKKDVELVQQLQLVRELLEGHGFACVSEDGMEADDVMASFAAQFTGNVTLLTQDKDMRQCLSEHCNILLDVEWAKGEFSGDMVPDYKWLTAAQHTEATGIPPGKWIDYQCVMGDSVDGIKGVEGIGQKGAADLIKEFGSVEAVIAAAKAESDSIKPAKRKALVEFEPKLAITQQLVALRTDLPLPTTRI